MSNTHQLSAIEQLVPVLTCVLGLIVRELVFETMTQLSPFLAIRM